MLEEGGVVHPGRQENDGRILRARRYRPEHLEEILWIALDRPDLVVHEELRPDALEDPAVLDDVGHAGGHPEVVLEDVPGPLPVAHEVTADDVRVHAERDVDAAEFPAVPAGREHEVARNETGAKDLLVVIEVVQEQVECPHALLQPALDASPLVREHDARDEVERHRLLGTAGVLVHRERDPLGLERELGGPLPLGHIRRGERGQAASESRVMRPDLARADEHLVPESVGRVPRHRVRVRIGGHATAAPVPLSSSMISACFVAASRPWAGPL